MEKLRIYQDALKLVAEVYLLIKNNSKLAKDFSLNDQLKRATISIVANIAEGYKRTKKQYKNYLQIASGSCNEVVALLQIVELVYKAETKSLRDSFNVLGKRINALYKVL